MTIVKNKITLSRFILVILALIIIARSIIPLLNLISQFPLNDFSVYLDGTKATLAGKNPYELWFFDRYNYPPAATLFFTPFVYLPINVAEYIFTLLSIVSLWFTVSIILKKSNLLVFALALRLFPVKLTLSLGQINLVILFLLVTSFYFQNKKPFLAGVLLGIASAIKLTPIPLIIYHLIKKNYRTILSFIIFIIFINIIAIIVFGLHLNWHYYTQILPELNSRVTQTTLNATYMNQSLTALLGRWNIFGDTNTSVRYLVSFATLAIVVIRRRKFTDLQFFSQLLIIVILFLPVFVWQHHYVFVIPLLLSLLVNRKYAIVLIFYLIFNLYFRDSGQIINSHPLITSHFLSVTLLLTVINLLAPRLNHKTH